MKSNLEKLLAAARAHQRPEDLPPSPSGLGGRLLRRTRIGDMDVLAPDNWLRGLAYGLVACALVAAAMAAIPPPPSAAFEFQILAGIDADDLNLLQP